MCASLTPSFSFGTSITILQADNRISHKVFIKSFYRSHLPHKSVNLSFTITNTKNMLTDLCGNWLLQKSINASCEIKAHPCPYGGQRPFDQVNLPPRNQYQGLMRCKFGHVPRGFWGSRNMRSPPSDRGRCRAKREHIYLRMLEYTR